VQLSLERVPPQSISPEGVTRLGRPPWGGAVWERRATATLVFACAAVFVVECVGMRSPVVDDAAITLAYARTLFGGGGLRLTFASAQVEGFSSPLWLLLSGLSFPLHLDPLDFARGLGVLLGALALAATALFGVCAEGRPLRLEDAAAPLLICLAPNFVFWADSGMENSLHALLLVAATLALIRDERTGTGSASGFLFGLLCLTRPEAPLAVLVAALYWLASRAASRRRPGRQELRLAGGFLLACGWLPIFRWVVFARLLPNTYYAKRWWDYHTLDYLSGFARAHLAWGGAVIAGGLLALFLGRGAARRGTSLIFATLGAGVVFIVTAKGDWMSEWRFVSPLLPLAAMALPAGASALRTRWSSRGAGAAAVLVAVAVASTAHEQAPEFARLTRSPGFPALFVMRTGRDLRALCDSLGIVRGRLAFPDIGGTALALPDEEIIDLAGLADFAIAEHVYDRTAQEDYLLSEGLPDVLDPHGQAWPVARFARLMSHYVWHGSTFILRGLTAQEDPRCPGGLDRVKHLAARELELELEAAMAGSDPARAIALWRCGAQHLPRERLPIESVQARLSEEAKAASDLATEPLRKLRLLSLATILAGEEPHLRAAVESLRSRLSSTHLLQP